MGLKSDSLILVIDDEDMVRDSVTAYLEDSGFRVMEANSGKEGLAHYARYQPDLILCDLKMPRMSGIQVLENIMSGPDPVPFIVLSGAGVMTDVVDALKLGASDYLFKPLSDMAVLEHSIIRALERSRLRKDLDLSRKQLEVTNGLLRQELDAGRKIQLKILPDNQTRYGKWEFEYRLRPSHFLSGDFLDYFELKDGRLFFYLVDVSGHGVSSALIAMTIKNFIDLNRKTFKKTQSSDDLLSGMLSLLNQYLLELGFGRHATIFAAVLEPDSEVIHYSNAAHFPTAIILQDGHAESEPLAGKPVGLFEDIEFDCRSISMKDAKGLMVCSDGLLEVMKKSSLEQKEDRLRKLVARSGNNIDTIFDEICANSFDDVPDDITIMTLNKFG